MHISRNMTETILADLNRYCHATTGLPKIGPPRPFMAATGGPPDHLRYCRWSPQTNYGAVVGPPLPHLVPRIIQRLLLFIEP